MKFRIREFREAKKLTQEELHVLSGVSRTTISNLEAGREIVTTTGTLFKLAKALDTGVRNFFE